MHGMYFSYVVFCIAIYCNLLWLLLLPFLYIHTCVIFNKCIQTLKKTFINQNIDAIWRRACLVKPRIIIMVINAE